MDTFINSHDEIENKIYDFDKEIGNNSFLPVNNERKYYTEEQFNVKILMEGILSSISTVGVLSAIYVK